MNTTRLATTMRRASLAACVVVATPALAPGQERKIGYDDTPVLPDSRWRVHDGTRPQPPVVTPPRVPGGPPSDAVVLFDGSDLAAWTGRDGKARWKVEDGVMTVNGTGDIQTRARFGDCQLHIEWATPSEVKGEGQGRGNSGVFFFGRYEVQVLDSSDNVTYPDGQAAALYGQYPPLVNVTRGPGEWQSYDIVFEAPRFDDNKLVSPAYVTVFHNGVCVQLKRPMYGPTGHRSSPEYRPHGPRGPIKLQDHGNPMRFRNIWVRELGTLPEHAQVCLLDAAGRRELGALSGRPLLMHLFAADDDGAVEALKALQRLRPRVQRAGGEVIGIATGAGDGAEDSWTELARGNGIRFPIWIVPDDAGQELAAAGVQDVPSGPTKGHGFTLASDYYGETVFLRMCRELSELDELVTELLGPRADKDR